MELLVNVQEQTKILSETLINLAMDADDQAGKVNDSITEIKGQLTRCLKQIEHSHLSSSEISGQISDLKQDTEILYSRTDYLKNEHETMKQTIQTHETDIQFLKDVSKGIHDDNLDIKKRLQEVESRLYHEHSYPDKPFFQIPDRILSFIGRNRELYFLKCKFIEAQTTSQTLAICGLGGIGKTTLAIEYAWLLQEYYPGGVFWLSAANNEEFGNSIGQLAIDADIDGKNLDEITRKSLKWLASIKQKWLLVVDNLDEFVISKTVRNIVTGAWRRRTTGHILITTRREILELTEAIRLDKGCCIDLTVFDENESIHFMRSRTELQQNDALEKLVDELGGLPLALEQAATYIKTCQFSYEDYLKEFKKRRLELIEKRDIAPAADFVPDERLTIKTTWSMNFDLIKRESTENGHGDFTSMVMHMFAFCSPDDLPVQLINKGQQIFSLSEIRSTEIAFILTKFSLFHRKSQDTLRVHRLVQEVIRDQLSADEKKKALQLAVQNINGALKTTQSPFDVLRTDFDVSKAKGALQVWNKLALNASTIQKYLFAFVKGGNNEYINLGTIKLFHEASIFHSINQRQDIAYSLQDQMLQMIMASNLTPQEMLPFTTIKVPLMEQDRRKILNCIAPASLDMRDQSGLVAEVDTLRERGNDAYRKKHYQTAIKLYTEAVRSYQRDEVDDRIFANRSQCYLRIGEHRNALDDADKCIISNPRNWKGHARRSYAIAELVKEKVLPPTMYYSGLASASIASYLCQNFNIEKQTKLYYPILLYNLVNSPSNLEREIQDIMQRQFTTLLLPKGHYKIDQNVLCLVKSLQLVGIEEGVKVEVDKTGLYLARLPRSEIKSPFQFEVPEHLFIHLENIDLIKYGGLVCVNKNVTALFYRCKISNGTSGCRDYPSCVGGEGCVNTSPTPCSASQSIHESNNERRPLGQSESGHPGQPGIVALNGGRVFIDRCEITQCGGGGVLCDGEDSYLEVKNCDITDMIQMGLEVRHGGYMKAENNEITRCNTHGVLVGPSGNCSVRNNMIYGNGREGILCCRESNARILNNIIHHNGLCGVSLDGGSYELISNQIYENWCWGIMAKTRSSCSMINNDIFENKCGGVRIGWNYSATVFIDGNTIRDHCGPALYVLNIICTKYSHLIKEIQEKEAEPRDEVGIYTSPPILTDRNIIRDNDKEFLHPSSMAESITVCFYCHKSAKKLRHCAKCKKGLYCSKACQTRDWEKHKHMCRCWIGSYTVTLDMRNALEIPKSAVRTFHSELSGIMKGPKPDRNRFEEFIVKIQTGKEYFTYNENSTLSLYDRSKDVDIQFKNAYLYHLIMECGQLGKNMLSSKKIFCWAYFEKRGSVLRIRTDTLAPYQLW
ncbi:hypothetical protein FSP39_009348 [Pinctada imbricata]|uniref:MYND-type domain-containing protein n=1 Tax=Pinctada imbricata TaxID=66713 RepID=A0AA88XQ19_PINIB|nr:hypothetical protein FSP39_009348 [Pinctada imbricata]